ncbi:MAG: glycosyltransferase family 4 protein [Methanosarcinales archaeon]|nr:glycosyltransferase family 4 protein [Methanothrix sp.]NYT10395.1 glycosyltransferase family 4 protein [Methanosarcinales archaeon]
MKPYKGPVTYLMESILMNFTLLRHIKGMDSKTIILEDMDDSQDLFIFNAITRAIRRLLRKEIYIVPVIQLRESDLIKNRLLRSLKLLEESIFFNSSDGIVVNSRFTCESVKGTLRRKIDMVIAYPGLNVSGLGKKIAARCPGQVLHLLFVGYITSRKGVDVLIRATEILIKERGMENTILHIVGNTEIDKNYFQEIKKYSQNAAIDQHIIFHGWVDNREIEELYLTADIFVFPSLLEGFGMVLAEAASYGLPIVTTDAGAIPYLIKDGVNGILVPPGDANSLALAIEHLAASPDLREKFSQANRKLAEKFQWERSLSKITAFLQKLAD